MFQVARYFLVNFMMETHANLFHIPEDVANYLQETLQAFEQGRTDLPVVTMCQRISVFEYEQQKERNTNQHLEHLINQILDDLTMSLKEKKGVLKHIQKHHPEVFVRVFPDGEI